MTAMPVPSSATMPVPQMVARRLGFEPDVPPPRPQTFKVSGGRISEGRDAVTGQRYYLAVPLLDEHLPTRRHRTLIEAEDYLRGV